MTIVYFEDSLQNNLPYVNNGYEWFLIIGYDVGNAGTAGLILLPTGDINIGDFLSDNGVFFNTGVDLTYLFPTRFLVSPNASFFSNGANPLTFQGLKGSLEELLPFLK